VTIHQASIPWLDGINNRDRKKKKTDKTTKEYGVDRRQKCLRWEERREI
jgi:hypothetical protein